MKEKCAKAVTFAAIWGMGIWLAVTIVNRSSSFFPIEIPYSYFLAIQMVGIAIMCACVTIGYPTGSIAGIFAELLLGEKKFLWIVLNTLTIAILGGISAITIGLGISVILLIN